MGELLSGPPLLGVLLLLELLTNRVLSDGFMGLLVNALNLRAKSN